MAFKIHGKVIEKETGKGIPNLRVKAVDKDLFFDDLLGAVTTDENGNFEIKYDKEDFQELFFDKKPDIYLKIKNPGGEVIHTTENRVRYDAGRTEEFIINISKNKMEKTKKWPVTLKVEIEPEGLKRAVKEGRLMEFVDAFSTLAGEHIRAKVVDELAKAGTGLTSVGEGIGFAVGFDIDDKYGTGPKPPWPWPKLSATFKQELRQIVRQEIASMK